MVHSKFWQGFFAIAPMASFIFILIGYGVFMFTIFNNLPQLENNDVPPMEFFKGMGFFFLMILLAVIVGFASMIFYIVHAVQNPNLKENNMLVLWIVLFVFLNGIGQFIYWLVEIIGKRNNDIT